MWHGHGGLCDGKATRGQRGRRAILDSVIPKSTAQTGRPARDRREMLNGSLWILFLHGRHVAGSGQAIRSVGTEYSRAWLRSAEYASREEESRRTDFLGFGGTAAYGEKNCQTDPRTRFWARCLGRGGSRRPAPETQHGIVQHPTMQMPESFRRPSVQILCPRGAV